MCMKIRELIKILETTHDLDATVSIPSNNRSRTENIWYSFDDASNIELYEVSSGENYA